MVTLPAGDLTPDLTEASLTEASLTEDSLVDGRVRLLQPREGYRVAIDPVLLAAAVPARPGDRILDMGCGAGAVGLCLAARCSDLLLNGLERDPVMAGLAQRNFALNGLGGSAELTVGDVLDARFDAEFDQVVMNPPYLTPERAGASPVPGRQSANVEDGAGVADWIAAGARALRHKGRLTLIHRADRMDEIIAALAVGFGETVLHPLWPKQHQPAKRVIITARKGVASPAAISPGTVLHAEDGSYTDVIQAVLAGGALTL
jgi:tRNA1(Val) A37 N6-methylase TrmN6